MRKILTKQGFFYYFQLSLPSSLFSSTLIFNSLNARSLNAINANRDTIKKTLWITNFRKIFYSHCDFLVHPQYTSLNALFHSSTQSFNSTPWILYLRPKGYLEADRHVYDKIKWDPKTDCTSHISELDQTLIDVLITFWAFQSTIIFNPTKRGG